MQFSANIAMACTLESANAADYISPEEATTLAAAFFDTSNLRVIDLRVGAFAGEKLGYFGDHKLLTIKVQRDHEDRTEECTFFLKTLLPKCNDFDRLIFAEEREFFSDALSRLLADFRGESWAPKCYLVKDDLLVLEDLRARGFQTPVSRDKLTDDQLRTAIATIARFHACSMILQTKLHEKNSPDVFAGRFKEKTFLNDKGLSWKWLATGIEVAESIARDLRLDPTCVPLAYDMMLKHVEQGSTDIRGNVLCHEDLWRNNLMFSADDKHCRLVDFQMVSRGSFAIDVLQLLYVNTDRDTRRRLWDELVRLYHSVLEKTLEDNAIDASRILSLHEVSQAIEEKQIFGLVIAVQFKPVTLLDARLAREFSEDPVLFEQYAYTSRKDFVNKAMQLDEHYRRALEESVTELVEFMERFQDP